ncbi:MAG: DNA mismatch endonuclease Vsr [Steroidobacteraceae bacterium]
MDRLSKAERSWNMSRISGSDTAPERAVRSLLHKLGYRFRLHSRSLPGRPDIVLPKYRTIVFVHGCYWHRHQRCPFAYVPKTRTQFWLKKFSANVARDRRVVRTLRSVGWQVVVVWECELRNPMYLSRRLVGVLRG